MQIPFITPWQSQISHSLPVPDHVTVLLSPSPLRTYRLGVWELAPSSAGRRDTCSLAGRGVWNSFQESDRHVTCWCSGSDMPQISRHASVKTHVAGLSLRVLKPLDHLLHSVQVVSTLLELILLFFFLKVQVQKNETAVSTAHFYGSLFFHCSVKHGLEKRSYRDWEPLEDNRV